MVRHSCYHGRQMYRRRFFTSSEFACESERVAKRKRIRNGGSILARAGNKWRNALSSEANAHAYDITQRLFARYEKKRNITSVIYQSRFKYHNVGVTPRKVSRFIPLGGRQRDRIRYPLFFAMASPFSRRDTILLASCQSETLSSRTMEEKPVHA